MQATIQRTQDMSGIKHQEDNKAFVTQTNVQTTMQKQLEHKLKDVNKKDNADYNQQKYDAKEKGKNEYFSQKQNKEKKDSDDDEDGKVIVKRRAGFNKSV